MDEFRLSTETHISQVHLRIADLERALAFYKDLLGFRQVSRNGPLWPYQQRAAGPTKFN